MMFNAIQRRSPSLSLFQRARRLSVTLVFLLCLLGGIGIAVLYSAGGGSMSPWAQPHMLRLIAGLIGFFCVTLIPLRFWYRLSYPIYAVCLLLLIIVEVKGAIGMGAQRWIDLGFIRLQPSELMKVALVIALARFYHKRPPQAVTRLSTIIPPALLILLPVGLVLRQPDLGTAVILCAIGAVMMFLAGVRMWLFALGGAVLAGSIPLAWQFALHDYQKQRILTFLDPESDPLGAGYHVTQSRIAFGAGGIDGQGFLKGTQSRLNFLPEKQTDFVFTLWAEEFGIIGSLGLLLLVTAIFVIGGMIALQCRSAYARFVSFGVTTNFMLYGFVNMAMVMGLIPVVGVPFPLVSYGGTVILATLFGFGLVQACHIAREDRLSIGV